ncbi:hypothetical protein FFK22_014780 [Mycobacterium sp. KBS0706]|uniref:DUF6404 family protein n=1 Tax=Mycobacterium sp. KBS0706 TaxID=2578109 RepID=UPI00110F6FC7|nr:DUF6404 family protein [Mycobacterium sp. KBS0706]TSD87911.1 hypothetical protein FFK22_014780 [Mycobacterium sp. KBS0706]
MGMPVSFEDRLARSRALMEAKGIKHGTPPLHRLLWRLGFAVPPPLFLPPWANVAIMGVTFAVGWGILTWLMDGAPSGLAVIGRIVGSLLAGAAFGAIMAWFVRRTAHKHGLPSWEEV